jgi:hypothetical protein
MKVFIVAVAKFFVDIRDQRSLIGWEKLRLNMMIGRVFWK